MKQKGVRKCYCKARLRRIQGELLCRNTKAVKSIGTIEEFAGQGRSTATKTVQGLVSESRTVFVSEDFR